MGFFHRDMSRADLALVANNARVNRDRRSVPRLTGDSDLATLNKWLAASHEGWEAEPDLDHAWAEVFVTLESEGRYALERA